MTLEDIQNRKAQHIRISLRDDVTYEERCNPLFSEIRLVHRAFPGLKLSDVDLKTRFLNYDLEAPIIIEAMTGGVQEAKTINENIAKIASKFKIAVGLGSQRPIITSKFNSSILETYRVVRDIASDVPVIGNIGIAQLLELDLNDIIHAIEVTGADALAVHLNPAQEVVQPEGDTDFSEKLLERLSMLLKSMSKPVIVKEVGHGLSMEVVSLFSKLGIRIFDVAGACGTSWVKVEAQRCPENTFNHQLGVKLHSEWWGLPTPISIVETRFASRSSLVIASGGIWDGIKAAKSLALGANMVGFARPLLKALLEGGFNSAVKYVENYVSELRIVMFLVGAQSVDKLCKTPIMLGPTIASFLVTRGIDVPLYIKELRCRHEE
ncbi:MAG: type 2 isopentenyl-diphosphate Delta-isomerase [Desulfurococcaceae archaeon]